MNILYIAGWWPHSEDLLDGIFVKEQALAVAMYEKVTVIFIRVKKSTKYFPYKIQTNVTTQGNLTVYEITIYTPVRRSGIHDFLVKKAYNKALQKIIKESPIDIIVINVRTHISELALSLKVLGGIPVGLIEHSTYYHLGISMLAEKERKKKAEDISQWLANPQLKFLLPVSNDMATVFIQEYRFSKEKIFVIPNIANKVFQHIPLIKNNQKVNIVLVARWCSPKNPLLFLNALAQLPDTILASLNINWIGDGDQLDMVSNYIKDNLKNTTINLLGYRNQEFIAKEIQQSDFLVHPTNAENLPCIIIESLCCGTPVVTTNVNGIPDLINDSNGLMSPAEDVESFKINLLRMIKECGQYDRVSISKNALNLYSAEAVGKKTIEVYKKAIKDFKL